MKTLCVQNDFTHPSGQSMYNKYSDSIQLPALIRISDNLIIAKFELMKIIPAKYIIETGIRHHLIDPDIPIVETSSGTFALGLGIVCAEMNLPFFIISDPAIDQTLEQRLIQLGGKVQLLSQHDNPQVMRLNALKDYLIQNPKAYWTRQYDNLENQSAYAPFADYLMSELGKHFTLVSAVGSGGSACGTVNQIRKSNPSVRLVGVDTFGSVLFGLPNEKRVLRGLGNSIMPKNLHHHCFDEVHWVVANDAFFYVNKLHSEMALFCGPTTGATYQVASWIAKNHPNELVVCISPDTGHRYQSTIYNDFWLKQNKFGVPMTQQPEEIQHPLEAKPSWSYFKWNRRHYQEVMGI